MDLLKMLIRSCYQDKDELAGAPWLSGTASLLATPLGALTRGCRVSGQCRRPGLGVFRGADGRLVDWVGPGHSRHPGHRVCPGGLGPQRTQYRPRAVDNAGLVSPGAVV